MKALHLSEHNTDEEVKDALHLVGPLCALDADTEVAADGAEVVTADTNFGNARSADQSAQHAAEVAVDTKNSVKTAGIKKYNKTADKVIEKYAEDPDHQAALGFEMSKDPSAKGKCTKIVDGKATQWIHNGFVALVWKSLLTLAKYYVIEECTGDPAVEANWYPADKPTSNAAEAIVKPKTLGVPTWWRVTGWNAAGEGIAPSNPFGGDPIH